MILKHCRIVMLLAFITAAPASAVVNLQITEMWIGGLDGSEATSDWFELTNFGDMDATGLATEPLYYDDDSADPTKNDRLVGIDTIAAGESVVYLVSWEDDFDSSTLATDAFVAMWGSPAGDSSGLQIGYVDGGSGLSAGTDAVYIFDGNTADAATVDSEFYQGVVDVSSFVSDPAGVFAEDLSPPATRGDRAVDGVWGAYTGNFPASDFVDPTTGQAIANPIASPGIVPEPNSLVMLLLGTLLVLRRRNQ